MRIYTVICDGRPAAVVRADDTSDAIDIARQMVGELGLRGNLDAREPRDAEMVSWLEHRTDHLLTEDFATA
jgi:hypothetical protein